MESFASSTSSAERGKYYFVAKPIRIFVKIVFERK